MRPVKVLIVEDDRIVARDIQQQLTRIGHGVVGTTATGEQALALTLELRPDLVLMDIRLEGDMDGIDAAQRIRERCQIPVIFLTAYADDETVERASRTEPFGYLLKPFEDSQLRTVIEMAMAKHLAERKLRESERRFVATLSSIGDAVIATDDQARVTFMNPVAEALTGWPQADALGQPLPLVFRIVNEDTRETVEDPAAKVLRMGTIVGLANHTLLLSRDGRELAIDDSGSPIVDDHGAIIGTVLVFRDLTERRGVEEALRKAQTDIANVTRLTTMGELAASIAHEVNQPLTAIVTNAGACLRYLDEAKQAMERIVRDGHRAGDVVRSIRGLTRKSSAELAPLDINDTITDILTLLRGEFRRHEVTLEASLSDEVGLVLGDRVQLQQVMLNLIKNGIEAMAGVTTRSRLLRVTTTPERHDLVLVAVEDTGVGVDPTQLDGIFDAFFTTKQEGMGMGLAICRSIIESHGGNLWAAPRQPHGSVFRFTLGLATEQF
ncbi:histidine kinase [Skermanella stibiiresistens SB22]|uniref:histidine kinase n=1 Tax=Skermanella stibiiresistens SB22 TaxID=1385369 RepID=W9H4B5_9PROT|nr:response regulator [Skermanella stibiiresistens]EWY39562.1 histidine kinase [Skermanella stibiiresistens SB22]